MKSVTIAMMPGIVLAVAMPAFAQNQIWMSRAEALQCPMSGPLWTHLLDDAHRSITPANLDTNMDDDNDAYTLAVALVWLRLPNIQQVPPLPGVNDRGWYRDKVVSICNAAADETVFTDTDALVRNPLGYILAADIINLAQVDPVVHNKFRNWILHPTLGTGWLPAVRQHHNNRPNNQGLFAGATRVAADIYIGDTTGDEALAWNVFRRWLGEDDSPYTQSQWGGSEDFFAWQAEIFPNFRGINRIGMLAPDCNNVMRNVDGALPDDQRRGDCNQCNWNCGAPVAGCPPPVGTGTCKFTWHTVTGMLIGPAKTNYAYTGLQGALAQAVIHYRRGRDPWTIPAATNAIRRAFVWLRDTAHQPVNDAVNGTDDLWQAYIANRMYNTPPLGLHEDLMVAAPPGFQVGYADWTTRCSTWP